MRPALHDVTARKDDTAPIRARRVADVG